MPSFFSRMLGSSSGSQKRKQSREEQQAQAAEAFLAQGDGASSNNTTNQNQPQSSAPTSSSSSSNYNSSSRPVPIPKPSGPQTNSRGGLPSSSEARSQSTSASVDTTDLGLEDHKAQYGSSPHRAPHKTSSMSKAKRLETEEAAAAAAGTSSSGNEETDEASINDNGNDEDDIDVSNLASSLPQPTTTARNGTQPALPTTQAILANPSPAGAATQQQAQKALQTGGTDARAFDLDNMIARLLAVGYSGKASKSPPLKTQEITAICQAAREVFMAQPAFLELSAPVKIVGDIHGQYSDLIRLFEMTGYPPQANFLFLGDYVDRGKQSLETILLLLCYKIKYPMNFFMLRGNHESASVTRVYGFYDECKRRTNLKVWKTFVDVFNCLPIAATIANKIFCVHGGLSPSLTDLDNIRKIQRPTDVPDFGLLNDLLWSDPSDTAIDWEDNERGVSYCFGKSVLQHFLAKYDLDLLCRAHMVVEDGYEFWNSRQLLTIFSAPNYCGEFDNFGAVMAVNDDLLCSFELLKPLDGQALKKELVRMRRRHAANSS